MSLFHTPEKIGPKRGRTPEGFLVCYDVPLARVGFQEYGEHEINDPAITKPPDGYFRVERVPDEVFHPDSIASWNGKPVTNEHPPDLLTPATTREYQVGTMINPRRGTEGSDGLLFVDMVITDPAAMLDIDAGKREVSGGYECDYFEVTPGHLRQRNILGNHGALVDEGRCGEACSIHDHGPKSLAFEAGANIRKQLRERGTEMSRILDTLSKAFKTRDDKTFEQALGAAAIVMRDEEPSVKTEGGSHEIHLHLEGNGSKEEEEPPPRHEDPTDAAADEVPPWFKKFGQEHDSRWKGLDEWRKAVDAFMKGGARDEEGEKEVEGELEEEAPPGTELNDARGARDSAYLVDSFQETVAGAEVLVPGIQLPTLDRSARPRATFKDICGLRRRAIDRAAAQQETREMLAEVTNNRGINTKTATCRDVRNIFRAVVALKRAANARGATDTNTGSNSHRVVGGIKSLAALNEANAAAYTKGDRKVASR